VISDSLPFVESAPGTAETAGLENKVARTGDFRVAECPWKRQNNPVFRKLVVGRFIVPTSPIGEVFALNRSRAKEMTDSL
jgi:hypothetical protein